MGTEPRDKFIVSVAGQGPYAVVANSKSRDSSDDDAEWPRRGEEGF